ncbi:hypothetical protein SLEP1_g39914 [Rubroshorea leprosula]|uniref:Uncharacterized protein n=1 Tax=Rubroshorea leprosula TaxID=152421 RepID=A0AAV5L217_9ROSI|nr:hypothetical protein SLEP1_g39914 [Rubroshorea leprosula]
MMKNPKHPSNVAMNMNYGKSNKKSWHKLIGLYQVVKESRAQNVDLSPSSIYDHP